MRKTKDEYNESDWKRISINAKAINILHCALDINEYNCISDCELAKEIQDKLKVIYKGTNQVKDSKANLLVHDYELFEMKPGETIEKMSTRFTNLVNLFKALQKYFEEEELLKKTLRSLPKYWETKATVIFDIREFSSYKNDELLDLSLHMR